MDSYASECLNEFRLGNDLSLVSPQSYSEKKLNNLGYTKNTDSTCESFSITPKNNDNLLFTFDFQIGNESGTLIKTAIPTQDSASLKSCELWAGDMCSSNQDLKNSWKNIFAIEKEKSQCEKNFRMKLLNPLDHQLFGMILVKIVQKIFGF